MIAALAYHYGLSPELVADLPLSAVGAMTAFLARED